MEKMVLNSVLLLLVAVFAINFVSAEILIGQPNSLYSIGDDFSVSLTVKPQVDTNDFLRADIVCDNGQVEVYKSAYNIKAQEEKTLNIDAKLDRALFNDLSGTCYLDATFGSQNSKSQGFELSDSVSVNIMLTNTILSPGESFTVSGTAKKSNNEDVDGFIEILIPGTNSTVNNIVSNGKFDFDLRVPANAESGQYELTAKVYEKDSSGNVANQGSSSTMVKIKQIPKSIDIAIDSPSISPGGNLTYTALLYDQASKEARFDLSLTIYDSSGNEFLKKLVNEGQTNYLDLPKDASAGYWTIEVSYDSLSLKKNFFIEEVEKISFEIENETLVVKNIGNTEYKKNIEISIGDKVQIESIELGVGEEKRYKLAAPEGEYKVSVKEGSNLKELGSSHLTGAAIGAKDISSLSTDPKTALWFWLIIIAVLLALGIWYYRKVRSKSFTAKTPVFSKPTPVKPMHHKQSRYIPLSDVSPVSKASAPSVKSNSVPLAIQTYTPVAKSASSLVSESGNKEPVAVVAIKIKNISRLRESESSAFHTIEHALDVARLMKAKVYDQGAFKVAVFSSKLSKKTELDSYVDSVKFACEVDTIFKEFNKKYAIKIDYGIGAHVGDMFIEIIEGKPKFTSSGNTTILAKNASEKSNNEVLVSSLLHRKVYNIVKGESMQSGLYRVNSMLDRSQHSKFIEKFMKKREK